MVTGLNLKSALKRLDISQEEVAKKIGKSRQTIVTWVGKSELNREIVNLINERLDIDLSDFATDLDIVKPTGEITSIRKNVRNQKDLIPYYNADFMAGNSDVSYEDGTIYPEYYMDIPEFYGCVAFRAHSDSMEPKIRSGAILFAIKIDEWRLSLEYGQIYGITLHDGRRFIKYIRRSEDYKNEFILKSENKHYDDFEVQKDKIKNIWLIQGWIDKRA